MNRKALGAFGVAVAVMLAIATTALASHPRPKAATPVSFKLVPAFDSCSSINGTHGSPLALPSCSPPVPSSPFLTVNVPGERPAPFNTAPGGTGAVKMKATCLSSTNPPVENGDAPACNGNPGDQEDVLVTFALTGVRCVGHPQQGGGACAGGNGTAGAGSLYSGKVITNSSFGAGPEVDWRITDHNNALDPNPPGADCSDTTSCAATVVDFPFEIGVQCSSGACNYATSVDTVMSVSGFGDTMIRELKRAVIQLGKFEVWDAGYNSDLVPAPPPTTGVCPPACTDDDPAIAGAFMTQGLFAP
jgi:hypothetical protein